MADLILPGNALSSDVLSGKIFSSGNLYASSGAMPNNGAVTITPSGTSSQAIAAGYHNGSGTVPAVSVPASAVRSGFSVAGVAGTMPDNGAVTITPASFNQTVTQGFHNGSGIVSGDPNLVASNLLNGATIFGVTGANGGRRYATGTITSGAGTQLFTTSAGGGTSSMAVTVGGLSFKPSFIAIGRTNFSEQGTYYSPAQVESTHPLNQITFNTSVWRMDGTNAYANVGGFRLPVLSASASYTWYACE